MQSVLIVIGKLTVGGAERVGFQIGNCADPVAFQIDYVVFGSEVGIYEGPLLEKGCRIYHMDAPDSGYLKFLKSLIQLIRNNTYDVVHCHTMFNSGLVLRAAKRCVVPIRIAHSHSIRSPGRRSTVQSLYEKVMRRWILKDATHLIACGKAAGDWLFGEKAFRERGIVLLNGIELDRFRYDPQKRESLREQQGWQNAFLIGHVGHLASVKNQLFLIRLMPALLKIRPEAHLLLLGDGSDRPMLEATVLALALQDAVTMPGNVSNVNEYLSAMDVFVFPSLYEGMPLSVIEAQANGLPCILSDRVPKDVFLTDLVSALSLESAPEQWIGSICSAERNTPERYCEALRTAGFDVRGMTEKLYALYRGETP